uniref:putative BPI/LBP family protein At1g04970 n=1 Tax=Erigeron canadensis TaxID=72917 RepID=UPI001CB8E73B|nr:putative BPI/LBP family protein At1g04970 [Erigeron canadensis]
MGPKKFLFLTIPILLIAISSSLTSSADIISSSDNKESNYKNNGYISFGISEKGLEFAKDFLIQNAISALIPLNLPQIEKKMKIALVGTVDMVVSNTVIYNINVSDSVVKSGDLGVTIVAFDATADLSFDWSYSYSNWFFEITDNGLASVQVKGMNIGMTLGLSSQQGTLRVSPVDCGCYVNYISIILDGGASWLYQGFIDYFEEDIANAVEDTITKNVKDAVIKLDLVLQSLPKEVSVGDIATLNVTITDGPILSNTSLLIGIDGLFSHIDSEVTSYNYERSLLSSSSCNSQENMVAISVHETVLNSASSVYFSTNKMYWVVDELPDKKLYKNMLNTAGWRFIIPKLYKEFPNDAMSLNFTIVSPPIIRVENDDIVAAINSDVIINVMDADDVIPVACISMEIEASGFAGISLSTVAGGVSLSKFSLSLKWSEIGTLHMLLVQSMMSTILKSIIVPIVNLRLRVGYSIPAFHGYGLQNASIIYGDSKIIVCSNVGHAYEYIPHMIL